MIRETPKQTEEFPGMSGFFSGGSVALTLDKLSDEDLIFNMLQQKIHGHVFFTGHNLEDILRRGAAIVPYNGIALSMEAIRRHKSRAGSRAGLTSIISKSAMTVLTPSQLIVHDKKEIHAMDIRRGSIIVGEKENEHDRLVHGYGALVQLIKPAPSKTGKGFVPEFTDIEGDIYPCPTVKLPPAIVKAYAFASTAEEVPVLCANLGIKATTDCGYAQIAMVPAFVSQRARGGDAIMALTKIHAQSTPEEDQAYLKAGVPPGISPAYAPIPKQMTNAQSTLESAYAYLERSRKIRGSDNKGLAFNTASYYYGDLPTSYLRPVSIAHNLLWILKNSVKVWPNIAALYYNSDVSTFSTAFEIVALNTRISSYTTKSLSLLEIGKAYPTENIGWEPLVKGREYLFPMYADRSVTDTRKKGFQWTPDYKTLKEKVLMQIDQYQTLARDAGVKFHYAVLTKADPDILSSDTWHTSLHPHNGTLWWFPHIKTKRNHVAKEKIDKFCTRLATSNAWKNYYPFHRVPFIKFDLDGASSDIVIRRGGVMTSSELAIVEEFGPGEDVAAEPFVLEQMKKIVAQSLSLAQAQREKYPENVVADFPFQVEVGEPDESPLPSSPSPSPSPTPPPASNQGSRLFVPKNDGF